MVGGWCMTFRSSSQRQSCGYYPAPSPKPGQVSLVPKMYSRGCPLQEQAESEGPPCSQDCAACSAKGSTSPESILSQGGIAVDGWGPQAPAPGETILNCITRHSSEKDSALNGNLLINTPSTGVSLFLVTLALPIYS